MSALREDLTKLLNFHSAENGSNTPDFVLAEYLLGCLEVYEKAVRAREKKCSEPSNQMKLAYTPPFDHQCLMCGAEMKDNGPIRECGNCGHWFKP